MSAARVPRKHTGWPPRVRPTALSDPIECFLPRIACCIDQIGQSCFETSRFHMLRNLSGWYRTNHAGTISLHFQSSGHHCFPNTTLLVSIVSNPSAPYLDAPTGRLAARDAATAAALMPSWSKQASAVVARLSRHLGGRAGELVKPQHPCVGSDLDHVTMLPVAKGDVGVVCPMRQHV